MHRRSELVMDEGDAVLHAKRDGALATMEFFWRGLRLLAQYEGNREMALDCFILAHGKGEFIGIYSAVEIAIKHFQDPAKKAAATKCIKLFQDCLNIPPMPGQRDEKGRAQMSKARGKQLL
jgi:hypothetical protein